MALNAYLTLKSKKNGEIKGSVIQKGREGKILVIAASHQVSIPSNPSTTIATGRKIHSPFIITKELDKSSPLLYNILASNDSITEWKLEFWGTQMKAATGSGTETQKYTVKLTNVRIINIKFVMPNVKDPDLVKYVEYEEVSFAYETIEWIWVDGGITATDNIKDI